MGGHRLRAGGLGIGPYGDEPLQPVRPDGPVGGDRRDRHRQGTTATTQRDRRIAPRDRLLLAAVGDPAQHVGQPAAHHHQVGGRAGGEREVADPGQAVAPVGSGRVDVTGLHPGGPDAGVFGTQHTAQRLLHRVGAAGRRQCGEGEHPRLAEALQTERGADPDPRGGSRGGGWRRGGLGDAHDVATCSSAPAGSSTCTAHDMQGSKEWIVRSGSSG
ncbi:hypothetical protein SDC9_170484 [bioreactor metagenome]|uniref:Uncharacterized protein n=1 Tax=bioreactor metagenome TaxID=1076179 RepID=A0A645GBD0_9ZZZZ